MKVIIVEDEKLSAEHLENLLKKINPTIEVVKVIDSVKNAVNEFNNGLNAEIVFLDIHLADGISFEIFNQVNLDIPIVFTTAYDEYAIKAFKVNSVDYLLKPIAIEELRNALLKFKKLTAQNTQQIVAQMQVAYQSLNRQYKSRYMVKLGDQILTVKTDEINHFISEDGLTLLVTKQSKKYPIDYTLEQLELQLSPTDFFRINRKVIINISGVQKSSSYFNSRLKVTNSLIDDDNSIISRERVNDFKNWLEQ